MKRTIVALALLVLLAGASGVGAQGPAYHEWTYTYGASGGEESTGRYIIQGTLAQQAVETSSGTLTRSIGGIWRPLAPEDILVLAKEYNDGTPPAVEVGEEIAYAVAVTNNGYRTQEQVILTDTVPAGLSLLPGSTQANIGTVSVNGKVVTLSIPELTYKQIAVLTYRVVVGEGTEGQTITNTATVRSEIYGPISATCGITVWPYSPPPKPERHLVYLPVTLRAYSSSPPPPIYDYFGYLPLAMHNYAPPVYLDDAPDDCGLAFGPLQPFRFYRDNFDWEGWYDEDWYAFQATGGVTYTIETSHLEVRADTILALVGPDCATVLAENDDVAWPNNVASRIVWRATESGTYHVRVRSYDWRVYGEATGYALSISPDESR